jgi:hypothetical protein
MKAEKTASLTFTVLSVAYIAGAFMIKEPPLRQQLGPELCRSSRQSRPGSPCTPSGTRLSARHNFIYALFKHHEIQWRKGQTPLRGYITHSMQYFFRANGILIQHTRRDALSLL